MGDGYGIYGGAGSCYVSEESEIEGTTGRIYGANIYVFNQDNLMRLIRSDGSDALLFPATSAGLDAATLVITEDDILEIPNCTIAGDHTLGEGCYRGFRRKTKFTGQITLINNSILEDVSVYRSADNSSDLYGVIAPSSGWAKVINCLVEAYQNGSGDAAAIRGTAGGTIEILKSELVGSSAGGDGYAARQNSGTIHMEHGGVNGSTDWFDGTVYVFSIYGPKTPNGDPPPINPPATFCITDMSAPENGPYDLGVAVTLDSTSDLDADRIIEIPYPCYIRDGASDNPTYIAIHGDWLKYEGGVWVANLDNAGINVEGLKDGNIVAEATLAAGAASHETRIATFAPGAAVEIDTIRIRLTRAAGGLATNIRRVDSTGAVTIEASPFVFDADDPGTTYITERYDPCDAGGTIRLGDLIISPGTSHLEWTNNGLHYAMALKSSIYGWAPGPGSLVLYTNTIAEVPGREVGSIDDAWYEYYTFKAPGSGDLGQQRTTYVSITQDATVWGVVYSEHGSYTVTIAGLPVKMVIESANLYNICAV